MAELAHTSRLSTEGRRYRRAKKAPGTPVLQAAYQLTRIDPTWKDRVGVRPTHRRDRAEPHPAARQPQVPAFRLATGDRGADGVLRPQPGHHQRARELRLGTL